MHFHDIYYPFEYPREWVYQGRAWNEAYVLRAFLQFNVGFQIRLWNNHAVLLAQAAKMDVGQLATTAAQACGWKRSRTGT